MRLAHPLWPFGLRTVDHVGREIREEEKEGGAEEPLKGAETPSKHAIERPENGVATRSTAKGPRKQFHEKEAWNEQDREGEDGSGRRIGVKTVLKPGP